MFARAQEPFQDLLLAELTAERARETAHPPVSEVPVQTTAGAEAPRPAGGDPERRIEQEEQAVRRLEDLLFG